jgi:hypothetical protein
METGINFEAKNESSAFLQVVALSSEIANSFIKQYIGTIYPDAIQKAIYMIDSYHSEDNPKRIDEKKFILESFKLANASSPSKANEDKHMTLSHPIFVLLGGIIYRHSRIKHSYKKKPNFGLFVKAKNSDLYGLLNEAFTTLTGRELKSSQSQLLLYHSLQQLYSTVSTESGKKVALYEKESHDKTFDVKINKVLRKFTLSESERALYDTFTLCLQSIKKITDNYLTIMQLKEGASLFSAVFNQTWDTKDSYEQYILKHYLIIQPKFFKSLSDAYHFARDVLDVAYAKILLQVNAEVNHYFKLKVTSSLFETFNCSSSEWKTFQHFFNLALPDLVKAKNENLANSLF